MALTAKQAKFAELVGGGLNLSESYRRAYDAQGMSSGAIRVEGHRLARHPKIVSAVKALRHHSSSIGWPLKLRATLFR